MDMELYNCHLALQNGHEPFKYLVFQLDKLQPDWKTIYGHGTCDYQQSDIEKSKCTKYGHGTL